MAPDAAGFVVHSELQSGTDIPYRVDGLFTNAGLSVATLHQSEFAWEVQSLASYANFYQNDVLGVGVRVIAEWLDGRGGDFARATTPCRNDAVPPDCVMRFDTAERWNTTTEQRDATWLDQYAVGTHEFGHWIGLRHSTDRPSTNPTDPSMSHFGYGATYARTIAQDDANGMHVARPRFHIMSANDSFEYTSPFYGFTFRPGPSGGSATRYCNDWTGAANGVCFVQFNGGGAGGASYYQDIHNRSYVQTNMRARVRLRNRGSQTVNATVAVWFLDTGGNVNGGNCSLTPTTTTWTQCYSPYFNNPVTGNVRLRLEVYNKGPYNMDVDTQILGW